MLPDDMTILSVGDVLRLTIIDALSVDGVSTFVVIVVFVVVEVELPPWLSFWC